MPHLSPHGASLIPPALPCPALPCPALSYAIFLLEQVIQLFDSWAHHLSPEQFGEFSMPYAERIIAAVRAKYPHVPIIFHANGGSGKHAQLAQCTAGACGGRGAGGWEVRGGEWEGVQGLAVGHGVGGRQACRRAARSTAALGQLHCTSPSSMPTCLSAHPWPAPPELPTHLSAPLGHLTCLPADVIGLDWECTMAGARQAIGGSRTLQVS